MLDPEALLSDHGVRSVSKAYHDHPFELHVGDDAFTLEYAPAESKTSLFGGNSNWRGPVWFPLNYLLIEALQKHDAVLGDSFKIECPTGSGCEMTLWQVTTELTRRLITLFTRGADGRRPVNGGRDKFDTDPHWRDLVSSTSTSTATPAKASAPRTRRAGRAWWPSSSINTRNTR